MRVFCRQQRRRGERLSRHWHDLVRLDDAGYADTAVQDHLLALLVARHKSKFFAEKDANGRWIDYEAAVTGALQLVATGQACDVLADDYERMLVGGMLLDDEERFDEIVRRCSDIQARANAAGREGCEGDGFELIWRITTLHRILRAQKLRRGQAAAVNACRTGRPRPEFQEYGLPGRWR